MEHRKWLVAHTRPQWERIVCRQLEQWYGISFFCPLQKIKKQYTDRVKLGESPVFKGYVFVEVKSHAEQARVLGLDGVVNYVRYLGKPAVVPEREMELLRDTFAHFDHFRVAPIEKGIAVHITKDLFCGLQGVVKEVFKNRVVLEIPLLGCRLEARIGHIECLPQRV